MISAKDLTDEHRSTMEQWAQEGAQLADFQKRLKGQFGLNVTYMDTRFLILDLGLELRPEDSDEDEVTPEREGEAEATTAEPLDVLDPEPAPESIGGVKVSKDELTRPGAIVSGTVTFSDGERAVWLIDQMGRPGLDPETPGYQPAESDLIEFEQYLRALLEQG